MLRRLESDFLRGGEIVFGRSAVWINTRSGKSPRGSVGQVGPAQRGRRGCFAVRGMGILITAAGRGSAESREEEDGAAQWPSVDGRLGVKGPGGDGMDFWRKKL